MVTPPGRSPFPRDALSVRAMARALSNGRRILALIWSASGALLVAWVAVVLLQGIVPVGIVWLTKPLVDTLQATIGQGASRVTIAPLATIALAMGGLLLLAELLRMALQWISAAQSELVQDHVSDLLHAKASALDLAFFETPEFYDRLYRVRFDAATRPLALLESLGSLAQNLVTMVGIGALLFSYGAWIAVVLLVGTLPAFLVVVRASRIYHDWWLGTTTDRRRAQYYGDLLTMGQHAAEMRLFGLSGRFRDAFLAIRQRLRTERLRLLRDQSVARLGAELVALGASAGTIGWMIWRAITGLATLGDIALFVQAFQRGQGLVRALLANIGQIHNNGLFLETLFEYLDLQPTVVAPADPVPVPQGRPHAIRFSGVSFRYPGSDRPALERFDLDIPPGRVVAIVGANGAGKSTLVKLLCRFYDPDAGQVCLDGTDVRRFSPAELRQRLTVMFQVPIYFQGSVRDNIALSDAGRDATAPRVEAAARDAGLDALVARLPDRYDTLLGRAFPGGTELSAGEWQRVAMARAYYRNSGLIILDEPTSSLDAWAEAEWFERFRRLAQGATAVIITHRFSIARRADEIHVMEHGRVVESGSHESLLALGGRYALAWREQA